MKVLMLNGSPHEHGCTDTALREVASALTQEGVESEIVWIGKGPIRDCTACGACRKLDGRCVFGTTWSTRCAKRPELPTGLSLALRFTMPTRPERCFRSSTGCFMRPAPTCSGCKPGAAVVSARRGGTTASLDALNKYFTISQHARRFVAVLEHGARQLALTRSARTLKGLQTMRTLGRNMAWLLRCIEAGKAAGVPLPEREPAQRTNFIR